MKRLDVLAEVVNDFVEFCDLVVQGLDFPTRLIAFLVPFAELVFHLLGVFPNLLGFLGKARGLEVFGSGMKMVESPFEIFAFVVSFALPMVAFVGALMCLDHVSQLTLDALGLLVFPGPGQFVDSCLEVANTLLQFVAFPMNFGLMLSFAVVIGLQGSGKRDQREADGQGEERAEGGGAPEGVEGRIAFHGSI